MKLPITIEYNDGTQITYTAAPMKREAAGKPVKPIDIWTETIAEVIVGEANPKATQSEA